MKFMTYVLSLFTVLASHAGVEVYTGTAGEVLYLESASKLGDGRYLLKLEGIESKWSDHPFEVTKTSHSNGDRYSFDYEEELSTGKRVLTYQIIVGDGFTTWKGSRVKKIQLYYQEGKGKPLSMIYNVEKTEQSQKIDLMSAFKMKKFKPEVD